MTKRELLELLKPFADDQYVYIRLHSDDYPDGCQVIIQCVDQTRPWHADKTDAPNLVALVAHDRNKEPGPFAVTSKHTAEVPEPLKGTPVFHLSLGMKVVNRLELAGILTMESLASYSEMQLLKLSQIGPHSVAEIRKALAEHGLQLRA